jgi:transketolase
LNRKDFRDAVFAVVHDLMRVDSNVVVLTNDNHAWGLDTIRVEFPKRAINVGVAEQNMFSLAGGLASAGKRVFCYGQCAHLMRGWEQIKVGICIPNFPVAILGVGGPSMYRDGPTHYGDEDIALMRALDNMTVYELFEWEYAQICVKRAYDARTPHYLRFDKWAGEPLGGGIPFGG